MKSLYSIVFVIFLNNAKHVTHYLCEMKSSLVTQGCDFDRHEYISKLCKHPLSWNNNLQRATFFLSRNCKETSCNINLVYSVGYGFVWRCFIFIDDMMLKLQLSQVVSGYQDVTSLSTNINLVHNNSHMMMVVTSG